MLSHTSAASSVVRTTPETDAGRPAQARGLNVLRWISLVADPLPPDHDELACRSLTTDRHGDAAFHGFL